MYKLKRTGRGKGRFNYCKKLVIYKEQHDALAKKLLTEQNDYFGYAREILKSRELATKIDRLLHFEELFPQSKRFEDIMEEINSITRQNLKKEVEIEMILKKVIAY